MLSSTGVVQLNTFTLIEKADMFGLARLKIIVNVEVNQSGINYVLSVSV